MLRPMPPSMSRTLEKLDKQQSDSNDFTTRITNMTTISSINEQNVPDSNKGKDIPAGVAEPPLGEKEESHKTESNGVTNSSVLMPVKRVNTNQGKPDTIDHSLSNAIDMKKPKETLDSEHSPSEVNGYSSNNVPSKVSEQTNKSSETTTSIIQEIETKAPDIPSSTRAVEDVTESLIQMSSEDIKTGKRKRTASMDQSTDQQSTRGAPVLQTTEDAPNDDADDEAEEEETGTNDPSKEGFTTQAAKELRVIEEKFTQLMTSIDLNRHWDEKSAELDREKDMVLQGSHHGYMTGMDEIERRLRKRVNIAHARKRHYENSTGEQCQFTHYRANCEFVSERLGLRKEQFKEVSRRRWRLKAEYQNWDDYARVAVYALPDQKQIIQSKHMKQINVYELTRVQEEHGFPAAPWIERMSQTELESDLKQMQTGINIDVEDEASEEPDSQSSSPQINPIVGPSNPDSPNSITIHSQYTSPSQMYTEGDRFNYFGQWFAKGDPVLIIDNTSGRYTAKFLTGTKHEVLIQRTDGSKTRLQMSQLRDGRYQMHLKES